MATLVYIMAAVLTVAMAEDRFPCNLMQGDRLLQTRMDYQINTGSNTYKIGGQVQVKLGHHNLDQAGAKFRFIIQANKQGSLETVGSWAVNVEMSTQCDRTNQNNPDTLYVIDQEVTNYTATWNAPAGDKTGDAVDMEFYVIFMDADDNRHGLLSIGMSPEAEEPVDVPIVVQEPDEVDEEKIHNTRTEDQLKMDAQKKEANAIDAENRASEDDWNKQQVQEMRLREEEMHQEEMEYERLQRQEEEDRLARIRSEIRDLEEHDRLEEEKKLEEEVKEQIEEDEEKLQPGNDNKIDIEETPQKVTAGSAHIVGGVTCLVLLVLQALL